MIGIKIEGQDFLELPPEVSLTVRLENPILGGPDKLSPGSYSYPLDIPAGDRSPSNAAKIKNPDVVENNDAYSVQSAELFFQGMPFKKGNLKTTTSTKDSASSYFTFGLNSVSADFKTAKLRSVLNETITIASSDIVKRVYVKKTTSTDFKIKLNDTEYTFANSSGGILMGNSLTTYDAFIKTLDKPSEWWPVIQPGVGPTPGGMTGVFFAVRLCQYYTVSPGETELRECTDPLIEMHVELSEGEFPGEHQVESDLGNYYDEFESFMSTYLTDPYPNDMVRFPVVFNANLYGGDAVKTGEGCNLFTFGGFLRNNPNWGYENAAQFQVQNNNSVHPFLLLKYVLDRIGNAFGFTWFGDFYDHPEVAKILLWNTAPLDLPQNYIGTSKFVFWKRSFTLSDLIEDITVVEFLKRLQSRYNLCVYIDELTQKGKLSFRESIARSLAYEDLTAISSPIKSFETARVEGYQIKVDADSTDAFSVSEQLTMGASAETTVDVSCGRLFREGNTILFSRLVSGPRVSQKMNEKGMLRVFHYAGLVDNVEYTYASALISGPGIPESLNDLHEAFHQIWLEFEKNRIVIKIDTTYPLRSLLNYDFELKRRYDRTKYIVKSIEVRMKNGGLEASQLELYSMK